MKLLVLTVINLFYFLSLLESSQSLVSRIIGGTEATPGQIPWQAQILVHNVFSCGGAILSKRWVVTTANCIENQRNQDLLVIAGSVLIGGGFGSSYHINRIFTHEEFDGKFINNIGLLYINNEMTMGGTALPAKRVSIRPVVGTNCIVSGWGVTNLEGQPAPILKYFDAQIIAATTCTSRSGIDSPGLFCLYSPSFNTGICDKDIGGPVYCPNYGLAGLSNFVIGECANGSPDGFVDIAFYNDWIDSKINITLLDV